MNILRKLKLKDEKDPESLTVYSDNNFLFFHFFLMSEDATLPTSESQVPESAEVTGDTTEDTTQTPSEIPTEPTAAE